MIQDIRVNVLWRNHPKRAKLAFLLGHDATGYVLDLWIATAQSKPDGVLRGLDDMDIALMAGWRGQPQDFVSALQATRLLDRLPDGTWALHDWAEHQAYVVTEPERVAKARKAINARWDKAREGQKMDAEGPGCAAPVARKMPEVVPKNGETISEEYDKNTPRIPQVILKPQSSNTPLQCLSSLKGRKTPPERATALSTPKGVEGEGKETVKKFIKPTLEQIEAYCAERGNGISAQSFLDHYTANGWKVGRNPMKDWRATVRTWEAKRALGDSPGFGPTGAKKTLSPAEKLLVETAEGAAQ